jgi:hypothetical protein
MANYKTKLGERGKLIAAFSVRLYEKDKALLKAIDKVGRYTQRGFKYSRNVAIREILQDCMPPMEEYE